MVTISNIEMTVLGLICEKSMHGYEIEKTIKERNMRYWTEISFSSIYKVLRKLEQKKLIKSKIKLAKNNISQKLYTITKKGQQVVKEKVKDILSNVEKIIWRIDLGISNLYLLNKEGAIECFKKYIESINERLEIYKQLNAFFEKNNYPQSDHALAIRPMMHLKTEKEWAIDFLNKLRGK
jgi:DNA-binding PadR family transcriptional regulator